MTNLVHAIGALRKRGPHFVWTYAREALAFDIRNRTRTAPRVAKDRQSISAPDHVASDGILYVASFTSTIKVSIAFVRAILGEDADEYQFIDLGCGRAKSLILFAQHGAARRRFPAVGIEYDPELAESGRRNLARAGLTLDRATVVTDSAEHLAKHVQSRKLVVYMFNPFQGDTLLRTLDELSQFDHYLIYVDPQEAGILTQRGYSIHHEVTGRYPAASWLVASRAVSW